MTRRGALTAAALASLLTRARAAPPIELARCEALDGDALTRALDRELAAVPADASLAIAVACASPLLVDVRVRTASTELERSLDLAEVPADLRARLVALVTAELVVAALGRPDRVPARAIERRGVADGDPGLTRRAAPIHEPGPQPHAWTAAAGPRLYSRAATPLAEVTADFMLAPVRLGVTAALGQVHDSLGTLRPYLATATATLPLRCAGAATTACVSARGELGVAGVWARPAAMATAHALAAPYAQLGLAVELARAFDGWVGAVGLDAGYAAGAVGRIDGRDAAALAGLVLASTVAVRWW
jgi:hypothetical protein